MNGLTTERSFDSQATWVIYVLGIYLLVCYPWMFVHSGTGKRPVNWYRNQMSVLYILLPKLTNITFMGPTIMWNRKGLSLCYLIKEPLCSDPIHTRGGGGGGGFGCLCRVQKNFFNESPSARPWPCKSTNFHWSIFETEIWACPHKKTARSICLGRLLHCGQLEPR